MKNQVLFLAVGIGIGLCLGLFFRGENELDAPTSDVNLVSSGQDSCRKYKDMYDRVRLDYLKLQDQQLEPRDDSHCSQNSGSPEKKVTSESTTPPSTSLDNPVAIDTDAYENENEEKPNSQNSTDAKPVKTDESYNEVSELLANIKSIEKELGKADSPAKKFKFLDHVKLSNPMQTIDAMSPVSAKDKFYEKIFGTFKGTLRFTNKERKNGRISLVVRNPNEPDDPKAWVVRIDVDNGSGKISRQNGGIDMLRTISEQSNGFFLRSSESSYLQMFYRTSSDQFLGNFYEKNASGEYPQRGTFWLQRKDP